MIFLFYWMIFSFQVSFRGCNLSCLVSPCCFFGTKQRSGLCQLEADAKRDFEMALKSGMPGLKFAPARLLCPSPSGSIQRFQTWEIPKKIPTPKVCLKMTVFRPYSLVGHVIVPWRVDPY